MRVRVKICGITNQQDADCAAASGADALGFVLYEASKRCVSISTLQAIACRISPFVRSVGLFVNAQRSHVMAALAAAPELLLQFHGDESVAFCQQFGRPYIKAVRVRDAQDIHAAQRDFSSASALLLDTYVVGQFGGTGVPFDWRVIPKPFSTPLIVAGGLSVDNVDDLLRDFRPYAVDVSSGVEAYPGKKDPNLLQAFCKKVTKCTKAE